MSGKDARGPPPSGVNIEGATVGIRTFRKEDALPFYEVAAESVGHMYDFMPWCHSGYSEQESRGWVESREKAWIRGDEYSFIIYSRESAELLGGVAINQINRCHKIGNLGYWVRKRALNRGVATEAALLVAEFGFDRLHLNRLEIVTLPDNRPSRRVAEKMGALFEGILRKRLVVHDEARDACMYSLVRDDV